jgi:hypothetical protein
MDMTFQSVSSLRASLQPHPPLIPCPRGALVAPIVMMIEIAPSYSSEPGR